MPIAPSANAFLRRGAAFQALVNRRVCTKPPLAGARPPSRARSRKNSAPLGDGSALHDTPPMAWTAKQVGEWLATLGHSQHVEAFAEERVDGRLMLLCVDDEVLQELGVKRAEARRAVMAELETLRRTGMAPPRPQPGPASRDGGGARATVAVAGEPLASLHALCTV